MHGDTLTVSLIIMDKFTTLSRPQNHAPSSVGTLPREGSAISSTFLLRSNSPRRTPPPRPPPLFPIRIPGPAGWYRENPLPWCWTPMSSGLMRSSTPWNTSLGTAILPGKDELKHQPPSVSHQAAPHPSLSSRTCLDEPAGPGGLDLHGTQGPILHGFWSR